MAENGRRKRGGRVALEQSSGRNVEPFLQYLETWRILGRQFALGKVNPEDRGAGRGGGGEKEKRGEELETEEGGEVGLRSRRKSWLITSLQRDDRFPTSRGERERQTEKEREANLARQHRLSNLSLPRYTLHDPLPACIQAVYVIRYFGSRSFMTNYVLTVNASVNRLNHSALNCREFFITFFLSFFFASSLSFFLSIFRQQQQL